MPQSKNMLKPFPFKRYVFLLATILLLAVWVSWPRTDAGAVKRAADIEMVELRHDSGRYFLTANANLELHGDLKLAVERGVPLSFTYEVRIYDGSGSWRDRVVFEKQMTWEIQYSALMRQWVLRSEQSTDMELSLDDCMRHLNHLKDWNLGALEMLDPNRTYTAAVRVYLDTSLLPRAFEFDAISNPAWALATSWKMFEINLN